MTEQLRESNKYSRLERLLRKGVNILAVGFLGYCIGFQGSNHASADDIQKVILMNQPPVWSSNGDLAYHCSNYWGDFPGRVCVITPDGKRYKSSDALPADPAVPIVWSPDGKKIVYWCRNGEVNENPPLGNCIAPANLDPKWTIYITTFTDRAPYDDPEATTASATEHASPTVQPTNTPASGQQ